MKKEKKFDSLKALGLGAAALSMVATLISSFVDEKKTDAKITEKVNEALTTALTKKDN